jgi:hypothetical protein
MSRIACMVVLLTASSLISAQGTQQEIQVDQEHTRWIASVIESIRTIKPGMTRRELLGVFTTEGGISTRLRRTHVYKQCPYIKVTVEFEAAGNRENGWLELPEDRIVKISAPFLQYGVYD